jgi:peptidyl-tRNA hydrolase, PTH1 family
MSSALYDKGSIKAIIGLGNPGAHYYTTRHSIGFFIIDVLADKLGCSWKKNDLMEYAQGHFEGELFVPDSEKVYLIKPLTFMNSSQKVLPFLLKKGIKPEEILVIHDELEKSFGKVNIKLGGSARGHNGLRSIIGIIGKEFWRCQFGVGRPERKEDVSNYVLEPFSKEEEAHVGELAEKAIGLILQK